MTATHSREGFGLLRPVDPRLPGSVRSARVQLSGSGLVACVRDRGVVCHHPHGHHDPRRAKNATTRAQRSRAFARDSDTVSGDRGAVVSAKFTFVADDIGLRLAA